VDLGAQSELQDIFMHACMLHLRWEQGHCSITFLLAHDWAFASDSWPMSCACVVQGACVAPGSTMLVCELMEGGSVHDLLRNGYFPWAEA